MKHFLFYLTILLSLITASCCKSDSPGDCGKCYKRLAGTWTLNSLATNGIDSIDYYDAVFATKCTIEFGPYDRSNHSGQWLLIIWGDTSGNNLYWGATTSSISEKGSYLGVPFYSAPDHLTISTNPFSPWFPLPNIEGAEWKMNKLSDTELWFELDRGDNIYEMRLNK